MRVVSMRLEEVRESLKEESLYEVTGERMLVKCRKYSETPRSHT